VGGGSHCGGCGAGGNFGVSAVCSLSLSQGSVYVCARSGSQWGSDRKVYFDGLSAGIQELCGLQDMLVSQNRRA